MTRVLFQQDDVPWAAFGHVDTNFDIFGDLQDNVLSYLDEEGLSIEPQWCRGVMCFFSSTNLVI